MVTATADDVRVLVPPAEPPSPPVLSREDVKAYHRYILRSGVSAGVTVLLVAVFITLTITKAPYSAQGGSAAAMLLMLLVGFIDGAVNHKLKLRVCESDMRQQAQEIS